MVNTSTVKEDFAPVQLSKIHPNEPLCVDIFLKINDKFIKFKEKQDCISAEKYDLFIASNVKNVYIALEQLNDFMKWIKKAKQNAVNELVGNVGEQYRDLAEARVDLKERVYDVFTDLELTSSRVMALQETANEIIEDVSSRKIPATILAKLRSTNQDIAEHSINVANLSVYLAMALGHGHKSVLENVYMGALFHDYGKAKIPPHILENPSNVLYSQAIQDHPMKGANLIKKVPGISEEVVTIVAQHHEYFNGGGFPKGIKEDKIYKLARTVAFANFYDHAIARNRHKPKDMYKLAIKTVEYDRGKIFDPTVIPRVVEALTMAFI
ncbi:MAG: HD domain-containing protein [Bacteriovoracaceae bacterium]|nr:HD domain-containing protein [Bacteriovoracaceae bacterium]